MLGECGKVLIQRFSDGRNPSPNSCGLTVIPLRQIGEGVQIAFHLGDRGHPILVLFLYKSHFALHHAAAVASLFVEEFVMFWLDLNVPTDCM